MPEIQQGNTVALSEQARQFFLEEVVPNAEMEIDPEGASPEAVSDGMWTVEFVEDDRAYLSTLYLGPDGQSIGEWGHYQNIEDIIKFKYDPEDPLLLQRLPPSHIKRLLKLAGKGFIRVPRYLRELR